MTIQWTQEEIDQFDKLADATGSGDQLTRINARLDMRKFIETHGKDKCDAMWNHLEGIRNERP